MTHKTEKILAQIAQDPTKSRLIEIGVSVESLEKEKRELKASKGNLDKNAKNARLAEINTELSNLKAEKENIKKSKSVKPEAPQNPTAESVAVQVEPVAPLEVKKEEPAQVAVLPEAKNERADKLFELNTLINDKVLAQIEAIQTGKEMGMSKENLLKEGLDKDLIDKVYEEKVPAPSVKKEKLNAILMQIMKLMESEKEEEEEYEKERQIDLAEIEANKAKLAELIELRSKLVAQEKAEVKPEVLVITPEETKPEEELENDLNKNQPEVLRGEPEKELGENISDIEKIKNELAAKKEEIKNMEREEDKLWSINYSDGFWQATKNALNPYWWKRDIKRMKLSKKINALQKEHSSLRQELEAKEIKLDKESRPFLYFVADKVKNPGILPDLKKTGVTDLRWANWVTREGDRSEVEKNFLTETGEDEGFSEFNIFGFTKVIKNVNEIREEEEGQKSINPYSPKAIYKIIGPDGTIIADNIKGYEEATEIYANATESYKKKVEEEWNKLNKK